MRLFLDRIGSEISTLNLQLGSIGITWERFLEAAVVLCAALVLRLVLGRIVAGYFKRATSSERMTVLNRRAQKLVSLGVWFAAFVALLGFWGVAFSGLWTAAIGVLGVVGVTFLATWAIASNVTAGWMLAPARMFKIGETIEILPEEVSGRVVDQTLFFTVISDSDGWVTHIPNNFIFQRIVRCKAEFGRPAYDAILASIGTATSGTDSRSTQMYEPGPE